MDWTSRAGAMPVATSSSDPTSNLYPRGRTRPIMAHMRIGKYEISKDSACFVIAEIGQNHQGDVWTAKKLFDAAALAGVHAVKLQKRNNKAIFTKAAYDAPYDNDYSFGKTYGEHRDALEFGKAEYMELKAYAESKGLVFFATAFDNSSVDFLEEVGVPAYKVASFDVNNHPLLEYIASKHKPVFFSTGCSDMDDVRKAYDILRKGTDQVCIMQCTSGYPTPAKHLNLAVIKTYGEEFPDAVIGFSSHDNGIEAASLAVLLGARAIEKHLTLDHTQKGRDHAFSLEPPGMQKMVRDVFRVHEMLGSPEKTCLPIEAAAKEKLGKSMYFSKALAKGHVIVDGDIAFKSPGTGMPPSAFKFIVGGKLLTNVVEDQIVEKKNFEARVQCAKGHN